MVERVSKSQFKARAFEFFRKIEASGEPMIVTDRGRPVVEIRPYAARAFDPLERLRGSVLSYDRPLDPVGEDDPPLCDPSADTNGSGRS
jgi:antitoxin (DNA-binding transcriptional repressor) of toxin-antitoxin stability system